MNGEKNKAELKELLTKIARNEIRVSYSEPKETLSAYSSKIGGKPAVPPNFIWPTFSMDLAGEMKQRSLSFLAQFNLKDVNSYDTEELLPKEGIISFFYEQMSMPRGFDPKDLGSAKVYYFPNEEELTPMNIPEEMEEEAMIPELAIKLEKNISLPEEFDFESAHANISFNEDDYETCCVECGYEKDQGGDITKLLGYPNTIQHPMEEQCEMIARGYYLGNTDVYEKLTEAERKDIEEKSSDWILLLQMGTITTNNDEFMFGDCGHLYFWIRKDDLRNLNFDKIWAILQSN